MAKSRPTASHSQLCQEEGESQWEEWAKRRGTIPAAWVVMCVMSNHHYVCTPPACYPAS